MPSHLVLIAFLMFPTPWGHADHGEIRHFGSWTLRVHADAFTNRLQCRLTRSKAEYARGALVLHLPADRDTNAAVYRIDNGPPLAARADQMEIAGLGFALYNDDLKNPSGGIVRIPGEKVAGARIVQVQTIAEHRPAVFRIDGLDAALDAAHASGCARTDFE